MTDNRETPDPFALLDLAIASVQPIMDGVRSDQMDLPTPCTEWDLKHLLGHLVAGNERAARVAASGKLVFDDEDGAVSERAGERFAASAAEMMTALRQPGVRERMIESPFGTFTGEYLAGLRVVDLLSHGWDVAQTTGQPSAFDPDLCERALEFAHQSLDWAGDRSNIPFAPANPVADSAPAIDRLMAYVGREL